MTWKQCIHLALHLQKLFRINVTKGIFYKCKQCVPGSFSPPHIKPGSEAITGLVTWHLLTDYFSLTVSFKVLCPSCSLSIALTCFVPHGVSLLLSPAINVNTMRNLQCRLDPETLLCRPDAFIRVISTWKPFTHTHFKWWHMSHTVHWCQPLYKLLHVMTVESLTAKTSFPVSDSPHTLTTYTNWIWNLLIHKLTIHIHNNIQHVICTWVQ